MTTLVNNRYLNNSQCNGINEVLLNAEKCIKECTPDILYSNVSRFCCVESFNNIDDSLPIFGYDDNGCTVLVGVSGKGDTICYCPERSVYYQGTTYTWTFYRNQPYARSEYAKETGISSYCTCLLGVIQAMPGLCCIKTPDGCIGYCVYTNSRGCTCYCFTQTCASTLYESTFLAQACSSFNARTACGWAFSPAVSFLNDCFTYYGDSPTCGESYILTSGTYMAKCKSDGCDYSIGIALYERVYTDGIHITMDYNCLKNTSSSGSVTYYYGDFFNGEYTTNWPGNKGCWMHTVGWNQFQPYQYISDTKYYVDLYQCCCDFLKCQNMSTTGMYLPVYCTAYVRKGGALLEVCVSVRKNIPEYLQCCTYNINQLVLTDRRNICAL